MAVARLSVTPRHVVLVGLLLVVVNLPLLHGWWAERRVERDGVDVTATVVDHDRIGRADDPRHVVQFRLPDSMESPATTRNAYVDERTYDEAVATGRLLVRVLPDDPESFRAHGAQTGPLLVVITVVADLVLLALALLLVWRARTPWPEPDAE